jgi:hypothetical protein
MARYLRIAAAQLGPIHLADTRAAVVKRLVALMREAHGQGARFIVFPELALTTFFPRWWMESPRAGIRAKVADGLIASLGDGARETHSYFLTLRDKHISHSVNALEQAEVVVFLGESAGLEVLGAGPIIMSRILEDRETTVTFHKLTARLADALLKEVERLTAIVRDEATAMSPAQRSRLRTSKLVAPDPTKFSQRRKHS